MLCLGSLTGRCAGLADARCSAPQKVCSKSLTVKAASALSRTVQYPFWALHQLILFGTVWDRLLSPIFSYVDNLTALTAWTIIQMNLEANCLNPLNTFPYIIWKLFVITPVPKKSAAFWSDSCAWLLVTRTQDCVPSSFLSPLEIPPSLPSYFSVYI